MSEHDELTPTGAELEAWLDEAEQAPVGDFADVVRRASALPGARVSAQDVEEAAALPLDEAELRARANFGSLETFLDDASAFVAAQGQGEPPPMRGVGSPSRWRGPALGAVALVAAVGLLWVASSWWSTRAQQTGTSAPYSAAADRREPGSEQAVSRRDVPPRVEPPRAPERPARVEPVPEPDDGDAGDEPTPDAPERRAAPRPSLEELDQRAREAWRAGDLHGARKLFERVVARGGRSERADIAYGDLFALARRLGETKRLRRYWKRYVARFPRGRYIDDARAGLCRSAVGAGQRRCWETYLRARPQGTFRADAEAALQAD